jgi:protein ImuB
MQLELAAAAAPCEARRVVALCFPDLSLQRALRAREAARCGRASPAPFAVERDGRVAACNPEARERGVRPGDALAQARAACADLDVAPVDDAADLAELEGLAEALLALAPAVEVAPPDALLLDAGAAHLLAAGDGGERALAARALEAAAALGLHGRAAVASGRGPARALARHGGAAAPVPPGGAAAALAPLPLAAVVEAAIAERLAGVGLRSAGDLAALPGETLAHRFGPAAVAAWRLARGEDASPLAPFVPRALPREAVDLEAPVEVLEPLLFALKRLCDRAAARLAGRGLGATRLAVALRLDGADEERVEIALARPTSAAARWLLVARERLSALRLPAPVTRLALAVAEAAPAPREQLALGDRPEQIAALDAVLARLAARLGDAALFAAAPVERHRPEGAYRAKAFGACAAAGEGRGGAPRAKRARRGPAAARGGRRSAAVSEPDGGRDPASPPPSDLERPTRLLPRPEPLVALGEGGRVTAVRFAGRALAVVALSPAERLRGEWWTEPFDREYHRARLEGLGDCWIYRDAADGRLWLHGFFD